jgi:PAS domain S-box-containing protein
LAQRGLNTGEVAAALRIASSMRICRRLSGLHHRKFTATMTNARERFSSVPTITTGIWQLFGLSVGGLLVLTAALLWGLNRAAADRGEYLRIAAIEQNLNGLGEDLIDAETGQRGYLLTQDEHYLQPYRSGIVRAEAKIEVLRGLVVNPAARRNLDRIVPVVTAKLAELAATVALTGNGRRDAALVIVIEGSGQRLMDEFRTLRADTLSIELRLLDARRVSLNAGMTDIVGILLLGVIAVVAFLYVSTRRAVRNLGAPIQALVQGMLSVSTGSLEPRLSISREDEIGRIAAAFNAMTHRLAVAQEAETQVRANLEVSLAALKENEAQLQAVNERFAVAADSAGIGIWEFDVARGTLKWDEWMYRIYGVAPHAGIEPYALWVEGLHAEDRPRCEAAIARAIQGAQEFNEEFRIIRADGEIRHVRAASRASRGADRIALRMIGVNIDVTDRKRAADDLAETSLLLRTLLESLTEVAIIACDPNLVTTMFNAGAENLLGYTGREILGRVAYPIIHDREEISAYAQELSSQLGRHVDLDEVLTEPAVLRRPREWTYIRKDGGRVAISLVVTAMRTDSGDLLGYVGFAHDVTSQHASEESLRRATDEAKRANGAKSLFLANMSHEIRTPVNAVIGLTFLLGNTSLDAEQVDFVAQISRSSKLLLAVITDVLDLSKIEAGELLIADIAFSPRHLLKGLGNVMAVQAQARGIDLQLDLADNLPAALSGDAARLNQILVNLISNAIKFTERGFVRLSARQIDVSATAVKLCFMVKDTGIGIDYEAQAQLFTPFAQADESITRRYGGTGLGLSIIKSLATLMGGTVDFTSRPGEGSEFRVELEFRMAMPFALVVQTPDLQPSGGRSLRGVRLLVVDDYDINLQVTRQILEQFGAEVGVASNGLEAFDRLKAEPDAFDVVLMDVQMPILDGYETTRRIRTELRLVDLPVIALTAGALSRERGRAAAAGMDDFINKPFDPNTLVASVMRHARSRRLPAVLPIELPPSHPAKAAMAWPDIDGIDSADARVRLCDDVELFRSVLRRCLDEFSDIGAPADPVVLAGRLHKLRGGASLLGARSVQQLAADAETACNAGEAVRSGQLTSELSLELKRLRVAAATAFA